MKVFELIENLKSMPEESEVVFVHSHGDGYISEYRAYGTPWATVPYETRIMISDAVAAAERSEK